jgi:type IV secretory pathway VirD2 relaxase
MGRRRPCDVERQPSFKAQIARALAKYGGRRTGVGRTSNRRGRVAVREPHARSRRCVIKARYVPLTRRGRAATMHLAYLERDGVEKDGSPGHLYGPDDRFDAAEFRAPIEREPRQFRFIVSPEDGERLDLTDFTRRFMQQVERDTGRPLVWAAVNHHNTDNPHVHIVVRGLDRDGDHVRIDGRYIGREMRWRAQEIITRELGPRTELEVSRKRSTDIERERFTDIDRTLAERAGPDGAVSLRALLQDGSPDGRRCIARLQALEGFQLAHVERPGTWRLADGWKESLHELGQYHDVAGRLLPMVGREAAMRHRIVDEKRPVPPFEGVVMGKGLDDELAGTMFAALRTSAGDAVYLRVPPNIAESLREGVTVRVTFDVEPWLKPADRIIARFAQENGGIYDPGRHQKALENLDRPPAATGEPTPAERVAANVRRLERLSRYGLAGRRADGRWDIPDDLLGQLAAREQSHPQHRLRVEQFREPDRAREQRGDAQPATQPSTLDTAKERAAFGQALARELRLTFVSDPPAFAGRMLDCAPTSSGERYSQVVDYRRGQFTLVPTPPDAQILQGRTVTVSRDHERIVVRRGPEISR